MSKEDVDSILARKPKRRIEWVQKRLQDEEIAPSGHREVLFEVLTRREGSSFAKDLRGVDVMRVYDSITRALDVFTTRQQKQLRGENYVLRQLAEQQKTPAREPSPEPPPVRKIPLEETPKGSSLIPGGGWVSVWKDQPGQSTHAEASASSSSGPPAPVPKRMPKASSAPPVAEKASSAAPATVSSPASPPLPQLYPPESPEPPSPKKVDPHTEVQRRSSSRAKSDSSASRSREEETLKKKLESERQKTATTAAAASKEHEQAAPKAKVKKKRIESRETKRRKVAVANEAEVGNDSAEQARVDRELKRKAEEAEQQRKQEAAETVAKRKAEEAEKKRKQDAAEAEAKRKADEAEKKRKQEAAEALAAEAKRKAEEAEKKRKEEAAEAEAKRKAQEAFGKQKAEEAEKKRRQEAAEAEAKRKAEEAFKDALSIENNFPSVDHIKIKDRCMTASELPKGDQRPLDNHDTARDRADDSCADTARQASNRGETLYDSRGMPLQSPQGPKPKRRLKKMSKRIGSSGKSTSDGHHKRRRVVNEDAPGHSLTVHKDSRRTVTNDGDSRRTVTDDGRSMPLKLGNLSSMPSSVRRHDKKRLKGSKASAVPASDEVGSKTFTDGSQAVLNLLSPLSVSPDRGGPQGGPQGGGSRGGPPGGPQGTVDLIDSGPEDAQDDPRTPAVAADDTSMHGVEIVDLDEEDASSLEAKKQLLDQRRKELLRMRFEQKKRELAELRAKAQQRATGKTSGLANGPAVLGATQGPSVIAV